VSPRDYFRLEAETESGFKIVDVARRHTLLILVLVAGSSLTAQARQLAVIADNANATTNVTTAELIRIVTARTPNWPDGKPIKVVLRDPSCADMQLVLRKLFAMTPEQAHAFVNAHRDTILVADSDAAILQFVSITRGAIGIVDLYSLTKDVKVLKLDGKLPVEQAYVLRESFP
jgi:ABC-type phosphate transport system substrate-binding protein